MEEDFIDETYCLILFNIMGKMRWNMSLRKQKLLMNKMMKINVKFLKTEASRI